MYKKSYLIKLCYKHVNSCVFIDFIDIGDTRNMFNFFNYNFMNPIGMANWFMPNFSFPSYFPSFQFPSFNWFNTEFIPFNYNFNQYFSQLSQPSLFYQSSNYSPSSIEYSGNTAKSESSNFDTFTKSEKAKKGELKLDDYNAFKGERLAQIALNNSTGWTGYCAAYVKSDIQTAGLGSYKYGHAYQMPSILRNNGNFKEISPNSVDVKKLPAGCILVYDRGAQGYSKNYGHTEITTGDGRAVSDGITKHLHKKPSSIFIPV